MSATAQRYTAVAIVLHWAIAFAIALMIPLGFWMHEQSEHGGAAAGLFSIYQLHKSIGLTVLGLSLVRLAWRLMNPPPPMPEHMPAWERFVALATHWAFYALMIGLPLTGWLYVSAGWSIHDEQPLLITTHWFGLFVVPHLFGLPQASADLRETVAGASMVAHFYLAWTAVGLAALHVAATPNATFHATSFRHRSGANYEARGELTIRGRARNITLPFTLNIEGNRAVMDGRTTIDRNDFDIGKDTEADDMISREVEVILHVEAVRAS